jgi:hypothetical protein
VVAVTHTGCILVALRPFYINDADPGFMWHMEPANDENEPLPAAAVSFVFEAGIAAGKLAENSDVLAREPVTASVLIWRYREVVRTLANTLMSESYVGAERLREILRPVEAARALE